MDSFHSGNHFGQDAAKSVEYFHSIGFKAGRYENPADFFMKTLSVSFPKTEEDKYKFATLNTNYEKCQREIIWEDNVSFKTPVLDTSPDRKAMAPFKTQFI